MDKKQLDHYLEFSQYTFPGAYAEDLDKTLPKDIKEMAQLVRNQLTHRLTLENGRKGMDIGKQYGDMTKVPWYRQPEDDIFITAAGMIAELYRRNPKGLVKDREEKDRVILTCRFVSVLMASLLKLRGIPARVRSGFAPYFDLWDKSVDHWITEYWDKKDKRWISMDVDGSLEDYLDFDPLDMPSGTFDYAADAWFKVRKGDEDGTHFWNVADHDGLMVICWELFYDYHCLMNNEIIYLHVPEFIYQQFNKLTEEDFKEIDSLAELMQKPDENFEKLQETWNNERKFRIMKGGLL